MFIELFIYLYRTDASPEENRNEIINDSIAYGILSLMATLWQFIFGIFCVDCFNQTAIRQVTRIRVKYFESLMRQDVGWYDVAGGKTNFTVRISEYVISLVSLWTAVLIGQIVSFQRHWENQEWISRRSEPFHEFDVLVCDVRRDFVCLWMAVDSHRHIVCPVGLHHKYFHWKGMSVFFL